MFENTNIMKMNLVSTIIFKGCSQKLGHYPTFKHKIVGKLGIKALYRPLLVMSDFSLDPLPPRVMQGWCFADPPTTFEEVGD